MAGRIWRHLLPKAVAHADFSAAGTCTTSSVMSVLQFTMSSVVLCHEPMARLVSAFVLSRLDYCNAILAGLPSSTLAPLQRVQNAAARLVLDLKPRDHLTSAYHQLHWLPVRQRIDYKLCLLIHLAVIGKSPVYLASLLTTAKSRGSTSRSADRGDMFIPRTRLRQGDRAFSVAAPRQWNRLPAEIHCISNTEQFKRHLKTFLFKSAFSDC